MRQALHPLVALIVGGAELFRGVPHHRPAPQPVEDGARGFFARGNPPSFRRHRLGELQGRVEIPDPHQVFGAGDHRFRDVAPAGAILFDAEQVPEEQAVQIAQRRVGDRREPFRHALGGVVTRGFDIDRARARPAQFTRVGVGHELLVRVRREHRLDARPQVLERGFLSELRRRDVRLRQREQLPLPVRVRHEGVEGLCQSIGRPVFRDHRFRDKLRDRRVAHAMHHRTDDVDRAGHGFGLRAPHEELEHRVGGEAPRDLADLPQRLIELAGVRPADVLREAAQDIQEGPDADGTRRRLGALLELLHQHREPRRIADEIQQQAHPRVVELELRAAHGGGDEAIGHGRIPLFLAQDFRVVDLDDLEAGAAGRGPETRDPAVRPDLV